MKTIVNKVYLQKQGSVLAFVLVTLVIFLLTGVGLLSLSFQSQLQAIRTGAGIAARTAADAGLSTAVFTMNERLKIKPWDDSSLPQPSDVPLPNCNESYSYTISGDIKNGYIVKSTGKSGQIEKIVNAILQKQSLFDYGILVRETITLQPYTWVDEYDYPEVTDIEVQIGTASTDEGDILLRTGAKVDGDIHFGVDFDFPQVTIPELIDMMTPIKVKGTTQTVYPTDSGKYSSINISQQSGIPGVLEIAGGDVVLHIAGDIFIGEGCELVIKQDSSLTLYLDGNLISGNSSGINNESLLPSKFVLYGTGQPGQILDLKAKNDWYGAIYAPNANIVIRAQSDVYGAFTGINFEMKNSGNFYYDATLRDVGEMRFCIKRWWEG